MSRNEWKIMTTKNPIKWALSRRLHVFHVIRTRSVFAYIIFVHALVYKSYLNFMITLRLSRPTEYGNRQSWAYNITYTIKPLWRRRRLSAGLDARKLKKKIERNGRKWTLRDWFRFPLEPLNLLPSWKQTSFVLDNIMLPK